MDTETRSESGLFDVEVLAQRVELLLERHFLPARRVQRHAQQIAQLVDHDVGRIHVRANQAGDGVQGVEEEMRVQLPLQRLQLRLDQPRLEPRRVERTLLGLAPVDQRVGQADQEEIRHQLPVKLLDVLAHRRLTRSSGQASGVSKIHASTARSANIADVCMRL